MRAYFIYMMTNRSRVVLYTGVTNDLARRVWEHQHGTVKGFTKKYKLDTLIYYDACSDIRDAIAREKQVKGWLRAKKNALVETNNPKWIDLSPQLFDPSERSFASLRMTAFPGRSPRR